MKWGIVDADYSRSKYQGLAAQWLAWEAMRIGVDVAHPDDADGLLISTTSQQAIPKVRSAIRRHKASGKLIIIGGAGSYGPAVFDDIATAVCVGEGRGFLGTLLLDGVDKALSMPEVWIPGEERTVEPSYEFPWDTPPILHPDGRYRVVESRGCRHKCLFCQTGWERQYRCNDTARVIRQCRELERRGLAYDLLTNDAGATGIIKHLRGATAVSARFRHIETWDTNQFPRTVRIGVEGMSERLRRAVAKPIPHDRLVTLCHRLMFAGKTVRLFFITGLPLEESVDYDEFCELIRDIGKAPKGICHITMHAYIPQPATPLAIFPLIDEYWEREEDVFRKFIDGPLFSRRVNLAKPAMYKTRLKNSCLSMAATEQEIRLGWWHDDNKNWRVRYTAEPWKLRHVAAVYARHLGRGDVVPGEVGYTNG